MYCHSAGDRVRYLLPEVSDRGYDGRGREGLNEYRKTCRTYDELLELFLTEQYDKLRSTWGFDDPCERGL